MAERRAIPIDFNIDKIFSDGKELPIPKFVKAMVRLIKVVARENEKLVFMYPNYRCGYIPILVLATYFHFVNEKGSRSGIRILLVTNSADSVKKYRVLKNPFGNPFVDFVYSGFLSKHGYRRLKPEGSTRGSAAGKIIAEKSNVFIVTPFAIKDVMDQKFDLIIVENCQKMLENRYFNNLRMLVESKTPIFAIMTEPNFDKISNFSKIFDFKVLGWDEELLLSDAKYFNDIYASSNQETFYPTIESIDMPLDDYHKALNFILAAYKKSRQSKNSFAPDEKLDRIFIEFRKIIQTLSELSFPYQILCDVQNEQGQYPLDKRLVLVQGLITEMPREVNETLELQKILDLCHNVLELKPTKQKYYEENLQQGIVYFVAVPNTTIEIALHRHFQNRLSLNTLTPDTPNQIIKKRVILNNLTSKLNIDYKILKTVKTNRLQVLAYSHEKKLLERIKENKSNIRHLLDMRKKVLEELHVINYS